MSDEKRPANGNQLRDYRISQLEKISLGHDERMRKIEDALLSIKAGGISTRQLVGVVVSVLTVLITLGFAYLQIIK